MMNFRLLLLLLASSLSFGSQVANFGGGGGGGGTVTNVGLSLPASVFSVAGSPVTSSGTLTGSFISQPANSFFAGPASGPSAAPTFRSIGYSDLPTSVTAGSCTSCNLSINAQGIVTAYSNGTGGGGGITSINSDTTAAQLITGGQNISVTNPVPGTTQIDYTGSPTISPAVLQTTDNLPHTAYSFPVANNTAYFLTAKCVARRTDAADRAMYEKKVGVYQESLGGAQVQGFINGNFAESSDPSWSLTWVTSGNNAILQATGASGKTINWTCTITYEKGN